ncbi:alpha-ketoglutaric semialdehyde dehydrogenase GucD [Bacillus sp. FJAT-50079]|uniref:alpha-ketoglutaric semialdehyde dehydrogenase GucD n=1 Tax=Bacillus sp. FJAT-50079 TaxID=2833577 RepID=UPI001BC9FCF5|nr:alpha-ketoglutaric semialdehyde dehydrogenase GucD [Bacillus sp. FJAT-50079]MBS4209367.1 aldehyde dehydrogenase family protein [Bacillus sp. FJAT-50079]
MDYLNYIDGAWISAESKETLSSINPANTNEVIGHFPSSSEQDVDFAVKAAKQALKGWRKQSSIDRGNYLHKTADLLEDRIEDIAITATKEMGKTLAECKGEVARGVAILRYYAQEGYRKTGDIIPSADSRNLLYTTRVPIGVVGVISPWNFPIAIPIWKIAPALVFGNTVVFKPASETSITAAKIVEAFHEAGIPKGVLNLVQGRGSIIGDAIVNHRAVNGITFTGSNQVGKKVAGIAAGRGAKFQLEMGGKNPTIVLEDADLNLAAELTVSAAMKHTGQKCTATSRCFVQSSVYDLFKQKIIDKVKNIKVGSGLDPDTYMGPLASSSQLDTVAGYIEKGKEEGATLLIGGNVLKENEYEDGFYVEPTVFENVKNEMVIAQEEIFGPVLCLIKIDTFEEAIDQANDTQFGLAASLFTRDLAKSLAFIDEIEAGMIKVNGESAGVELQAPFGGMKGSSSYSREQGQAAIEFFTSTKTITITPTA